MVTRQYILLLILLVIIFFMKQLFFGEVFYCCDNLAINIPSKVFFIEALKHGGFPLWNPYILSGTPFLADINLGLLHPLNALYVIFSPFRALTIGVVIDFVLAISGMYILCKSLKSSSFAATLSAIIFTFSGTLVVYTNNVPMLQVASLLPWVLWAWMTFFNNPTKRFYVILVGLLTLQIIAGHPQLTYYTWLLGIAYVFFVSRISVKQKFISFIFVFGLVFLLSAVQIIPFIELVGLSTRLGRGFAYASFDSLHPFNIVRFIIPNIVGNIAKGTDWIQGGSVYGYIGILPLLLLFWIPIKHMHAKFFLGVAIASFFLALGKYTPIYFLFYKFIPGIGNFRSPQHFLLLYTFSMAILSGFSSDIIFSKQKSHGVFRLFLFVGVGFLIGALVLYVNQSLILSLAKFQALAPGAQRTIIRLIAENFLTSGFFLSGTGVIYHLFKRNASLQKTTLLFVVFLELLIFSRHGLIAAEEGKVASWLQSGKEIAQIIQEPGYEQYRIFVSPRLYANPVKKQLSVPYVEKEAAWQSSILRTNINMLYHLSTIDGYASLVDRSYKELFQKGEGDPTGIDFGDMKNIAWDNFGVRYILASPNEMVFKNNPALIPIWSDNSRILYKNPNALPVTQRMYSPKSVIIGFWLSIIGIIIYGGLLTYVRERKT